jgi:hypothetical protein
VLVLLAAQHVGAAVPVDPAGEQLAEGLDADQLAASVGAEQPFIREPLRQTRTEMRERGMQLPDLPADIDLGEDDG